MTDPRVPPGMRVVTKEEFFAWLHADPRDIMPSHDFPTFTEWKTVKERPPRVVGRTLPGWKNPSDPKVYMIRDAS